MARTLVSRKTGGGSVTPTTFLGTCSSDLVTGNAVLMINDTWQKADCTDFDKVPSTGVIVEKIGNTGCRVATFGVIKVPFSVETGKKYYLGAAGNIIDYEPDPSEENFIFSQQILQPKQ